MDSYYKTWKKFKQDLKPYCKCLAIMEELTVREIEKHLKMRGVYIHFSTLSRWIKNTSRMNVYSNWGFSDHYSVEKIMIDGKIRYLYSSRIGNNLVDFQVRKSYSYEPPKEKERV